MADRENRLTTLSDEKRRQLLDRIQSSRVKSGHQAGILRRAQRDTAPLSFSQQRLWFLDQLDPGTGAYNMANAVRLTGRLDKVALEKALQEIVRRHESLRTTFRVIDGEPVQVIDPEVRLTIPVVDLRHMPPEEREARALQLAEDEAQRPFSLTAGPVLRMTLLQLDEEEHVVLRTLHHVAADGWSMGIFEQELATLYEAFRAGQPSPLPELPLQYADYAYWQREQLQGEALAGQLAYWKRQLAGVPVLQLPTDRPYPAVKSHNGTALPAVLSPELSGALKALSRREGTTLFMTLLAAFQTLLYRYSGQEDISVGTPVANRSRLETEGLIGFFLNTLVLRTDLSGNPTFRELLGRVRETALGAFSNQDVPFEKLVEVLQPDRSMSHDPLFQVMFTLQNTPGKGSGLPGLAITPLPAPTGSAKFTLDLNMWESEQGLAGELTYNTDLFDAETIKRMIGHWQVLLEAIAADPDQRVAHLPLMRQPEREQVLTAWNQTAADYPRDRCFSQLFELQAEQTPEAAAVECAGSTLSYRELNRRANKLSRRLVQAGVGPDTVVTLLAARGIPLLTAILAVFKAGGAYLPLDPAHPPGRWRQALQQSGSNLVLASDAFVHSLQAELSSTAEGQEPSLWSLEAMLAQSEGESDANLPLRAEPHHMAYVLFTSGSTGVPKGVMVEQRGMVNHLFAKLRDLEMSPGDIIIQNATQSFVVSVWQFLSALLVGGKCLILPDEIAHDPARLLAEVEGSGATILEVVPTMLQAMLGHEERDGRCELAALRWLLVTGEAFPPGLCRWWFAKHPTIPVINAYGSTECSDDVMHLFLYAPPPESVTNMPLGRAIMNTQIYILDKHLQPVPIGVPGELYIGGDGLSRGYINRPELTAERFVANPFGPGRLYNTGDVTRFLADGTVEYLGRADHQVKIRGTRIELGEIEAVLAKHAGVRQAAVAAREDQPGNKRLVAYVVPAGEAPLAVAELRQFLRSQLPEYMVPSAFVTLPAMPLTASGKIDRRSLPAPEGDREGAGTPYTAPRTPLEEVLAGIWAEVLGLKQVGVHDHFFDLGGHSLLVTQIVARARAALGVDLPVRSLFEAPTVAELAVKVDAALRQEQGWRAQPIARVNRDQPLPLSFAQQRLWFLDQLEPGIAAYNIPEAVRLLGKLDRDAMEQALREIVRRHESLRTTFRTIDGQPVQVVAPEVTLTLPVVDLSHLPAEEREGQARRLATEEAAQPFDLASGPLLRTTLLRLAEEEHVLLWTVHHIASDRLSMGLFGQELVALYSAFVAGRPSPLPELPLQYADFAYWQRNWLQGEVLDGQLDYWKQQLAGVPVLQLPTDRPRPAVKTYNGAVRSLALSQELTGALKALSRREGTTLFMTLLAAFQTLLYRYTAQADISVGTSVADRNRLETEGLIGFFVNTLVMRTDLSGNPSFRALLRRVREVALGAYSNQDVPFEKLVEVLRPERVLSHDPLFQVMFTLQNASGRAAELPGLAIKPFEVEGCTAKYDLTLVLAESEQGLKGSMEYNTDLFDASTVERMLQHFETLLKAVVSDPDQAVSALPILTEAEWTQVVVAFNDKPMTYPHERCVHELIAEQALRRPEAIAAEYEGRAWSYAELNQRANQLAHYLRRLGVGPESLVGICVERSLEMVLAVLGVLKAGGAYVPLDPTYPRERIAFMLADSQVPVLLTQARLLGDLPESGARTVCLDSDWGLITREATADPESGVTPENLAYVIYTSGSTGKPKGAQITHAGLCNFAVTQSALFGFHEGSRTLQFASLTFDASVWDIFLTLVRGGTLVLAPRDEVRDPERLTALLARERITVLLQPPSLLSQLPADAGPHLETVVAGGEVLPTALALTWARRIGLWNAYGPTEVTWGCSAWQIPADMDPNKSVAVGYTLPNYQMYVLDQHLQPVPIGVTGEIYVGGVGVGRGYLNRPELTAERYIPDPFSRAEGARLYRTGDLGRWLPDGNLEFLGRVDDQVKIRGFRIELGELEVLLAQHEAVQDAVVVAREDRPGDKRLVAYYLAAGGAEPAESELRRFLRERVPDYMVPSLFVRLEQFPLTLNGKVDRRALPVPEGGRSGSATPYVAPRTAAEEVLAEIWSEVLGREPVGVNDDFFDLGGHSLLLMRLSARIRAAFQVEVPLRQIFERPTVAQIAEVIEEGLSRAETGADQAAAGRQRKEIAALLGRIDELSEEELDGLLAHIEEDV